MFNIPDRTTNITNVIINLKCFPFSLVSVLFFHIHRSIVTLDFESTEIKIFLFFSNLVISRAPFRNVVKRRKSINVGVVRRTDIGRRTRAIWTIDRPLPNHVTYSLLLLFVPPRWFPVYRSWF